MGILDFAYQILINWCTKVFYQSSSNVRRSRMVGLVSPNKAYLTSTSLHVLMIGGKAPPCTSYNEFDTKWEYDLPFFCYTGSTLSLLVISHIHFSSLPLDSFVFSLIRSFPILLSAHASSHFRSTYLFLPVLDSILNSMLTSSFGTFMSSHA